MRILGFMTGTSLDAVDMAVLHTDGEQILAFGPSGERKLSVGCRQVLEEATRQALQWGREEPPPAIFAEAERVVADEHILAALEFFGANGLRRDDFDLIGLHGQTVRHEPPTPQRPGRTVQLVDAQAVADALGLPVAFDFRTADVAAGGQGAPLAPVYHAALVDWSQLERPVAVLNLGGVGNITLVGMDGELEAFDTGPANGMVDLWMQRHTGERFDAEGAAAAAGRVDEVVLARLLAHPYFSACGPKSLDRFDFSFAPVDGLSLADGAATLTAFAAEAVAIGVRRCAERPVRLVACGGGRHNPVLMAQVASRAGVPVQPAEALGWRGDAIEAEAFAYLAARTAKGLPISFSGTTGVAEPMTGGRIVRPA